jgi:cell division protein YceG involved in septum cleavage
MNKTTIRAFAAGILFATTTIGTVQYYAKSNSISEKKTNEQLVTIKKEEYETLLRIKEASEKHPKPSEPKVTKTVYVYTLAITKGEASRKIAYRLEQAKIIQNAKSFLTYLENKDLTRKIRAGTYTVTSEMTYEDIGKMITK